MMSENLPDDAVPLPPDGQLLIYQDGATNLQVRLDGQTVWLSQRQLADLYQVSVPTINEHLKNTYEDEELQAQATIRKFRIVQKESQRQASRQVEHYSLDVIIAVGYRQRERCRSSYVPVQFPPVRFPEIRDYITEVIMPVRLEIVGPA